MTLREPRLGPSIDFALLADAIQVAGDRIHVLGGGWDTLWVHSFPATVHSLAVGMKIRVPWNKANERFVVEVDLEDEDGFSLFADEKARHPFELGRPSGLPHGTDLSVVWTQPFHHLELPKPGNYSFVIRIDGDVAERIRFRAAATHGHGA